MEPGLSNKMHEQKNKESGNTLIGCGRWGSRQPKKNKHGIPGLPIEQLLAEMNISVMGGMYLHWFLRRLQHAGGDCSIHVLGMCYHCMEFFIFFRSDLYNE